MSANKSCKDCLSNTALADMIRGIFKEEFEKQQVSLLAVISGNLEITRKEIKEVKEQVSSFQESLEFTQATLDAKIKTADEHLEILKRKVKDFTEAMDPRYVNDKLIELEYRSRRDNLRVDGIAEEFKETWEQTKEKIKKFIKEDLKVDKEIKIERAHRVKRSNDNDITRPKTVVF